MLLAMASDMGAKMGTIQVIYLIMGLVVFIAIIGLLGAIALVLAGQWLGFPSFTFERALLASITSVFVTTIFNFSISFQYHFLLRLLNPDSGIAGGIFRQVEYILHPAILWNSLIFGIIITAALFSRMLPRKDAEKPIKFCDGLALASLDYCIVFSFTCALALGISSLLL